MAYTMEMQGPHTGYITKAVVQAAVGTGVEDVREVRQRLVSIESGLVKMQRQEDKRGVDLMQKLSEQEVTHLPAIPLTGSVSTNRISGLPAVTC